MAPTVDGCIAKSFNRWHQPSMTASIESVASVTSQLQRKTNRGNDDGVAVKGTHYMDESMFTCSLSTNNIMTSTNNRTSIPTNNHTTMFPPMLSSSRTPLSAEVASGLLPLTTPRTPSLQDVVDEPGEIVLDKTLPVNSAKATGTPSPSEFHLSQHFT